MAKKEYKAKPKERDISKLNTSLWRQEVDGEMKYYTLTRYKGVQHDSGGKEIEGTGAGEYKSEITKEEYLFLEAQLNKPVVEKLVKMFDKKSLPVIDFGNKTLPTDHKR